MIGSKSIMFVPTKPSRRQLDEDISQELITESSNMVVTHNKQDSCRGCGLELEPFHFCSVCNQPYQFQCPECDQYLDEQIHSDCENVPSLSKVK